MEGICRTAFAAAVLLAFPVGLAAAYSLAFAMAEFRLVMKRRPDLVSPLVLLFGPLSFSSRFSETGGRYRKRALLLMLCFLLLVATAFLIAHSCGAHQRS
jgi:hypothetical protein